MLFPRFSHERTTNNGIIPIYLVIFLTFFSLPFLSIYLLFTFTAVFESPEKKEN
jgi:hypothetical protein